MACLSDALQRTVRSRNFRSKVNCETQSARVAQLFKPIIVDKVEAKLVCRLSDTLRVDCKQCSSYTHDQIPWVCFALNF